MGAMPLILYAGTKGIAPMGRSYSMPSFFSL